MQVLLQAGADKELTDKVRARGGGEGRVEGSFQSFPVFPMGIGKSPELVCLSC